MLWLANCGSCGLSVVCDRIFSWGIEIDLLNFDCHSRMDHEEDINMQYFDLYSNEPHTRNWISCYLPTDFYVNTPPRTRDSSFSQRHLRKVHQFRLWFSKQTYFHLPLFKFTLESHVSSSFILEFSALNFQSGLKKKIGILLSKMSFLALWTQSNDNITCYCTIRTNTTRNDSKLS